jgi:hypothetical protein
MPLHNPLKSLQASLRIVQMLKYLTTDNKISTVLLGIQIVNTA